MLPPSSGSSSPISAEGPHAPEVEILNHFKDGSRWSTFYRIGYRVRAAGASWVEGEREFLDRGDAVALLPFCPETGMVLLTRQFRMPIHVKRPDEALLVEVCGGILEHPDPEITVRQEAREELGLELREVENLFAAYSTPGSVCEKVHFFLATYSAEERRYPGGGLAHEGEEIEILELPLLQALAMVESGEILDLRTIALLSTLSARLLMKGHSFPQQPEESLT